MTDPYKVLGVSPDASDEEIKTAYRTLARKYHPDNYADNPLADLASEKMQEINAAYEEITNSRKNGRHQSSGGYQQSGGYQGGYSSNQFADIRRLISQGRLAQAEELLDGIPDGQRDAEWYFLKGNVYYSKGWLDDAFQYISRACQMNPQNMEYRAALNRMSWQRQNGSPAGFGGGYTQGTGGGISCCDMCAAMYCADCLCSSFGNC